MKAPDKIYIPYYPNYDGIDTHLSDDWFDSRDIDQYVEGWKEYIHKDALIEWLQKEYKIVSWYDEKMRHVTGCVGDTSSSGKAEAYQSVINKLNSM